MLRSLSDPSRRKATTVIVDSALVALVRLQRDSGWNESQSPESNPVVENETWNYVRRNEMVPDWHKFQDSACGLRFLEAVFHKVSAVVLKAWKRQRGRKRGFIIIIVGVWLLPESHNCKKQSSVSMRTLHGLPRWPKGWSLTSLHPLEKWRYTGFWPKSKLGIDSAVNSPPHHRPSLVSFHTC